MVSMRLRVLLTAILSLICATAVSAQGILPASFGGWTSSLHAGLTPPVIHNGDKATSMIADLQAAALKEYGFVAGERGDYTKGADTLSVDLYRMKDASGAYGLYTYLHAPEMARGNLSEHSAVSQQRAEVLIGNLLLDISGPRVGKLQSDLRPLVAEVKKKAEEGIYPSLSQRFPAAGLDTNTGHYFLGPLVLHQFLPLAEDDWLGFSDGAEAELANYRLGGHPVVLLIADYPTPQSAQKKLADLERRFSLNNSNPSSGAPIYAKRSLTLLAIVSGAQSDSEAEKLLKLVDSGAQVTWNEPNFEVTQPNIGTIIVGTIIGTGLICMFALISGIAFGGFRLVVKRFFPNQVFDRSSQMQVLQLGLTSKPINAEDFYGLGGTPPK